MSSDTDTKQLTRRSFLSSSLQLTAAAAAALALPRLARAQAACVSATPKQPEGPFYPVRRRSDENTDLTVVDGASGIADGEIVHVRGQVLDQDCRPVEGALVEIWQADKRGQYDHPSDPNRTEPVDPNFQYWGRAVTGPDGAYQFKTIIPGAYPADTDWIRPPHVHYKISKRGYAELITQMYFAGDPLNDLDLILQAVPLAERANLVVRFEPDAELGVRAGVFNIRLQRLRR